MFKKLPKALAHKAAIQNGNFVSPEYILHNAGDHVDLQHRYCPHRLYPLSDVGEIIQEITCELHGYKWDINGLALNNNKKLNCGKASVGRSGLIFKDFIEPDHFWVDDLEKENNLVYSHCQQGASNGSWLWLMNNNADLLHVRPGEKSVHPWLASVEDLDNIIMEEGDDWIIQTCSTGWWLFIYPFTFIEWSKGCLSINYTTPRDINNEFGFTWMTQFYYDPATTTECKLIFERLEDVFHEDVVAIEKQKGSYFPLVKSENRLEDHCVHFSNWYKENLIK